MQVSIYQLRSVLNRLLDHAEAKAGSIVDIDEDYYWSIPKQDLYNPEKQPGELTIGSLEDDLENLLQLMDKARDPLVYDINYAASILTVIANRVSE